jgi:hypothetical protein
MAAAAVLAAAGPGRYSLNAALGLRVPRPLVRLAVAGAATTSAALILRLLSAARAREAEPVAAPGGAQPTTTTAQPTPRS